MKSGNNTGSCSALLNYLEKEDKGRDESNELKGFFTANSSHLSNEQAKNVIEHGLYKKGLKNDADKFFTVTMSFSQDELKGKSNKDLQEFAQEKFASMYCGSVQGREVDSSKLAWVAKLETERKYKGDDERVKEGLAKSGQQKEGDQRHIHFIVARKTLDDKQISPMSNHFREGAKTGAVKSGFDQDKMKFECEQEFDKKFNHERKEDEKIKNALGDYRPDLVEKYNSKEIEQEKQREQQAKEKFQESQKAFEKTLSVWDKVKEAYEKAKESIIKAVETPFKKLFNKNDVSMERKEQAQDFLNRKRDQKEPKEISAENFINRTQEQEKKPDRTEENDKEKDSDKNNDKGLSL